MRLALHELSRRGTREASHFRVDKWYVSRLLTCRGESPTVGSNPTPGAMRAMLAGASTGTTRRIRSGSIPTARTGHRMASPPGCVKRQPAMSSSSSRLGERPLKARTRVRFPHSIRIGQDGSVWSRASKRLAQARTGQSLHAPAEGSDSGLRNQMRWFKSTRGYHRMQRAGRASGFQHRQRGFDSLASGNIAASSGRARPLHMRLRRRGSSPSAATIFEV